MSMTAEGGGANEPRRNFLKSGALGVAAVGFAGPAAATALADSASSDRLAYVTADTAAGKVRGLRSPSGVAVFKGIPYGADTSGDNRFMPPARPRSWQGVRDAINWGPRSPQIYAVPSERLVFLWDDGSDTGPITEDCLVLNIWTPAVDDRKKRPVMVRFHGGDYIAGTGNSPIYRGHNLARHGDVVCVTLNHRLGAVGHLDLSSLGGAKYATSGNSGVLDLVAALEWVRDNVANFGGDPDNVTIVGDAGGAMKVCVLLGMPSAKGLFHRAIAEGGTSLTVRSPEETTRRAELYIKRLGLTKASLSDIHRLPLWRLIEAQYMVASQNVLFADEAKASGFLRANWGPVLDGRVVPAHPFAPAAPAFSSDIPMIIGNNRDAASLFLINDPAYAQISAAGLEARVRSMIGDEPTKLLDAYRQIFPGKTPAELLTKIQTDHMFGANAVTLADRKSAQRAPVYSYRFDWKTPAFAGRLGATHSVHIPFVNDTGDEAPLVLYDQPDALRLAQQMSRAWVEFARAGHPKAEGLPDWPAYTAKNRATMVFNTPTTVVGEPMPEAIYQLWAEYGARVW